MWIGCTVLLILNFFMLHFQGAKVSERCIILQLIQDLVQIIFYTCNLSFFGICYIFT